MVTGTLWGRMIWGVYKSRSMMMGMRYRSRPIPSLWEHKMRVYRVIKSKKVIVFK